MPSRAREHIAKAQRLTIQCAGHPDLFLCHRSQARVEALDLDPNLEQAVLTQLIPAIYLERVAGRARPKTGRLQALSAQLLDPLVPPAPTPIRYRPSRPPFAHASRRSLRAAPTCSSAAAPASKAATATCRSITTAVIASATASWPPSPLSTTSISCAPTAPPPPSASSGGPTRRYSSRCSARSSFPPPPRQRRPRPAKHLDPTPLAA